MHNIPQKIEISIDKLAELAIDCWRMNRWISSRGNDDSLTVPRHVLRRLTRFIEESLITTIDLTGQPFDPGMAIEVVDAINDHTLVQDTAVISETISPIVMWSNIAIKHAQVAVLHNPSPALSAAKEDK